MIVEHYIIPPILIPPAIAGCVMVAAPVSFYLDESILLPSWNVFSMTNRQLDVLIFLCAIAVMLAYAIFTSWLPGDRLILGYRKKVWQVLLISSWGAGVLFAAVFAALLHAYGR